MTDMNFRHTQASLVRYGSAKPSRLHILACCLDLSLCICPLQLVDVNRSHITMSQLNAISHLAADAMRHIGVWQRSLSQGQAVSETHKTPADPTQLSAFEEDSEPVCYSDDFLLGCTLLTIVPSAT